MVNLNSFSEEEKTLLIKLPFQVGVNISESDDDGGDDNEALEMDALARIIRLLPGLYKNAPLTQEILIQTREGQENWSEWKKGSFDLNSECTKAIALLKSKADESEARAFRKALLEVADTVARAAGEGAMLEIRHEPDSSFLRFIKKAMLSLGMIKDDDSANISVAEQAAIEKIDAALSI